MSGADKLWLLANTADYVCGLMIDYYLYSMYEKRSLKHTQKAT